MGYKFKVPCIKKNQICNNIWKQYAFVRSYGCGLLQPKDN